MFTNIKSFIILAILYTTGTIAMEASQKATIFKKYDVVAGDPGCLSEETDFHLCPKDDKIPCSPVEIIEAYCTKTVGSEFSNNTREKNKGTNAVTGCMKYVGYHFVSHGHLACWESIFCQDQMEKMFKGYNDEEGELYMKRRREHI